MGFSLFQVIAVGVVNRVAVGPAVVRHKQNAVEHKSHNAFNPAVGVEGVMAAFMGDHPAAHRDGAGDHAVEEPEGGGGCRERKKGSQADGQQRKACRHSQARPRLRWAQLGELCWQGAEQLSFAGVGDGFSAVFRGWICGSGRCCKCQMEASRQALISWRLRVTS